MKTINSASDLAINGVPPAFDKPLHVGKPNTGSREKFIRYVNDIFVRGWLTNNGPLVQEFERRIAEYIGVKHCVAMCNGTIALEIAIRALGLEGEVIIPSYTFIATAHALQWQAITPIFADIDPATHTLDPKSVRAMITPKTTGIIGVHLWGRSAAVEALQEIADEHNLKLMFDAAHAFGCTHNNTLIGNFGECEVFSFHGTKFFNTFEGGAVVTNNDELADKMRLMRNFGFAGADRVIYSGTNGKMIEMAAAMGLVNLDAINDFAKLNRRNYQLYSRQLNQIKDLSMLSYQEHEKNNYQYIVVEINADFPISRDDLVKVLHAENILARRYFWPGCHNMTPYREYQPNAGLLLPSTLEVAEKVIVLPTGTNIGEDEITVICEIFRILSRSGVGGDVLGQLG